MKPLRGKIENRGKFIVTLDTQRKTGVSLKTLVILYNYCYLNFIPVSMPVFIKVSFSDF